MTIEEFNQLKVGDEVWCAATWNDDYETDTCKSGKILSISYNSAFVIFKNQWLSSKVYISKLFNTKLECIEYKINQLKTQIAALEKFKTSDKYEV